MDETPNSLHQRSMRTIHVSWLLIAFLGLVVFAVDPDLIGAILVVGLLLPIPLKLIDFDTTLFSYGTGMDDGDNTTIDESKEDALTTLRQRNRFQ